MARPEFYPEWARVEQMLPVAETINRTRPKESLRDVGYDKDQVPTAQEFNWQLNNIYEWIKDLDERLLSGTLNLEDVYPVGSIYINRTDSRNPSEILGVGTWVSLEGRVLVGVGTTEDVNLTSRVFEPNEIGGEFEHTQTEEELANHAHIQGYNISDRYTFLMKYGYVSTSGQNVTGADTRYGAVLPKTNNTGASQPMNVVQPYTTAYMWERVS